MTQAEVVAFNPAIHRPFIGELVGWLRLKADLKTYTSGIVNFISPTGVFLSSVHQSSTCSLAFLSHLHKARESVSGSRFFIYAKYNKFLLI